LISPTGKNILESEGFNEMIWKLKGDEPFQIDRKEGCESKKRPPKYWHLMVN